MYESYLEPTLMGIILFMFLLCEFLKLRSSKDQ